MSYVKLMEMRKVQMSLWRMTRFELLKASRRSIVRDNALAKGYRKVGRPDIT